MGKDAFRSALKALHLTCEDFAELSGWSVRTVYEWGERLPVPYPARLILELLAERNGVRLDGDPRLPVIREQTPARQRAERFRIG
jgi:hypothetical protein